MFIRPRFVMNVSRLFQGYMPSWVHHLPLDHLTLDLSGLVPYSHVHTLWVRAGGFNRVILAVTIQHMHAFSPCAAGFVVDAFVTRSQCGSLSYNDHHNTPFASCTWCGPISCRLKSNIHRSIGFNTHSHYTEVW